MTENLYPLQLALGDFHAADSNDFDEVPLEEVARDLARTVENFIIAAQKVQAEEDVHRYAYIVCVGRDLLEQENLDEGFSNEYVRGLVNLIADTYGKQDIPVDVRMDEVLADLRKLPQGTAPEEAVHTYGIHYAHLPDDQRIETLLRSRIRRGSVVQIGVNPDNDEGSYPYGLRVDGSQIMHLTNLSEIQEYIPLIDSLVEGVDE